MDDGMDTSKRKKDIEKIALLLAKLDKNSLLIVESSAKVLMARQQMEEDGEGVG